jgi:alpha-ketoglutarate-dependent taurine dioxygenase
MAQLELENFDGPFGAEVKGLTSASTLDAAECQLLCDAFDQRGVLVFRDLEIEQPFQMALVDLLIRTARDFRIAPPLATSDNLYVSNRKAGAASPFGRLLFHADGMWAETPYKSVSLFAEHIEQPSVPTTFASTANAWVTLPADLRARVEGLHAVHTAGQHQQDDDPDVLVSLPENPKSTTKPIAFTHPRTGQTLLFVSEQVTHEIVGMPQDEADQLLKELFAHLYSPANVITHEWRTGDLAVWDNLSVQHGRPAVKAEGLERTLRRYAAPSDALAAADKTFGYERAMI